MKKISWLLRIYSFILIFFISSPQVSLANESLVLHDEDVVALTKPAVIRIVHHVKGVARIPAVEIDLKNKSIYIDREKPMHDVAVDETLFGSGFIVSSDGYIVTNSHVVSPQTIKIDAMTDIVMPAMYESSLGLTDEESKQLFDTESDAYEFSRNIFDTVAAESTFSFDQEIIVLNPASEKESLDDLKRDGFVARPISINDNFYNDDKDVALIKIDAENLPTLSLGDAENISVGTPISIFGFPATAEFNKRNPLESTFTRGVISALKNSGKKIFKVFQTDAKVSEGSSGGPLVAADSTVIGIVTFESNQLQQNTGDNFAFSIPIEIVKNMIREQSIDLKVSSFQQAFMRGMENAQARHCVDALKDFNALPEMNSAFSVAEYVKPYIKQCEVLINTHQSIDSRSGKYRNILQEISPLMWGVIGVVTLFAFSLCFILWWLIREVKKEEEEIHLLEKKLFEEKTKCD